MIIPGFKPMLADEIDLNLVQYPVIASPKLDGVRATFVQKSESGLLTPLTRSLKPLANRAVSEKFLASHPLDGEFIVGDPTSSSVFRDTMKVVSSHEADIRDLKFYVFDMVQPGEFTARLKRAHELAVEQIAPFVPVPHVVVQSESELLRMEEELLTQGYEGVMVRRLQAAYKFGRSTTREGALLKMKRRLTSEAVVIDTVEQMHNANEAKLDNLGYTERSSHQANMVPTGVLGALVVRDLHSHVEFNIGTGFLAAERQEWWKQREGLVGKIVSYEYLPVGVKDKPRHPVFKGFRDERDMSK